MSRKFIVSEELDSERSDDDCHRWIADPDFHNCIVNISHLFLFTHTVINRSQPESTLVGTYCLLGCFLFFISTR